MKYRNVREIEKDLDAFLRAEMESQRIPGMVAGVAQGGQLAFARSFGLACVERSIATKIDTAFPILSVTKTFTAVVIMMLIEQQKLSLDDAIADYLPNIPAGWRAITIRHLLSMRSGLLDMYNDLPPEEWRENLAREEFYAYIARYPLKMKPGERQTYCNTNFTLLGWIAEAVTGKSFKEIVYETIFYPLGMTITPYSGLPADHAWGYTIEDDVLKLTDAVMFEGTDGEDAWNYGNGGFFSTLPDMVRFDEALLTEKLLRRSTMEQMWTPPQLGDGTRGWYGHGWFVNADPEHRVVAHYGNANGFNAEFVRLLTGRMAIIIFVNIGPYRGLNFEIIDRFLIDGS